MIDLIVPCFNEASRWNDAYWRQLFELPDVHWTFVDDGSTDGTATQLARTAAHGPATVLTVWPNGGKAEAVRRGMLAALNDGTDGVGFMDADGAFHIDDVAYLIQSFRQHVLVGRDFDAVWSSRVALAGRGIERHASRHYIGRIVATILSQGEDQMPYDTQSGLKFFAPSDRFRQVLNEPFRTRWVFELEILSRWRASTGEHLRVWEEPLSQWQDIAGSKVRGVELLRIARELLVIKGEQRRNRTIR